ncbi:MAG: hypothetical protein M0004_12500 [Actinomycetota bacterium]|nr:hypothetical protein [Actinomycetota bacterium]
MAASATEEASAAPPLARRARRAGVCSLAAELLGEMSERPSRRTSGDGGRSRVIDPVRQTRAEG